VQPPEQQIIVNGTPIVNTVGTGEGRLNTGSGRRRIMVIAGVCILIALLVVGVALFLNHKDQAFGITSANVQVSATGFVPSTVQITHGQGVTWLDKDEVAHQIFADQTATPNLDSVDMLLTGDSYTYVIEKPGTYHYYDPANTAQFQGTVIVK